MPARYVEGYLVRDLESGNGAQAIMDEAAHAWAEIYVKGVGWIPIEVTPGFIDEAALFCGKKRHCLCHILRLACAACGDALRHAGAHRLRQHGSHVGVDKAGCYRVYFFI